MDGASPEELALLLPALRRVRPMPTMGRLIFTPEVGTDPRSSNVSAKLARSCAAELPSSGSASAAARRMDMPVESLSSVTSAPGRYVSAMRAMAASRFSLRWRSTRRSAA